MTTQARELAGIISNAGDLNFSDDITLGSDASVLNFGADSEVTVTHVHNTGLLVNSTRQLQFGDSGTYINQSGDGVLNITSDTEVEINATTVDINANVDISGNLVLGGNITIGDADSDDISFGGELTSHIIPNADDTYDLGSSTKQWRNVYVDGTLEADAITIDGTTLAETIADTVGAMVSSNTESDIAVTYDDGDNTLDFVVGNISGSAALATSVNAQANNSTDETVYPTFVDGATGTQGIETDTGLTYNPSSGLLTSTLFAGTLNTAAQTNITSLGTLTGLTVNGAAVFNENSADVDFRVESNNEANAFVVNGGDDTILIGTAVSDGTAGITPRFQIEGTSKATGTMSITRNSNDVYGPHLVFNKTRGTAVNSDTIVQDNDYLGVIAFGGADGTDRNSQGAAIHALVDGTPGGDDTPGRMVFLTTADGANGPTDRMTILANGAVGVGRSPTQSNTKLEVGGADNVPLIAAEASGVFAGLGTVSAVSGTGLYVGTTLKFAVASTGAIGINGANYGTDGQIFTSGGAGAAAAWEDAPSSGISTGKAIAMAMVFG